MSTPDTRVFVPDPPPSGIDPELAEWLMRQLYRISGSSGGVVIQQNDGGNQLDGVRQDIDSHVQNLANPHATTAALVGAVDKVAADTKTGDLTMDGVTGLSRIIIKSAAYALDATPTENSWLSFVDENDQSIGGVSSIIPNPLQPDIPALAFGSIAENVPVYLIAPALVLDSDAISVTLQGAETGSRLVCAGFTLGGHPILGWEDPPAPAYDDFCENATDQLIRDDIGQGVWVPICSITTDTQIETTQTAYLFLSILADNRSTRTGSMDVAVTIDGAAPTSPDQTVPITSNYYEVVSSSLTQPVQSVLPIGTTLDLWARGTGDHSQFNLWTAGTDQASRLDLQVR